ncbi:NAD(P)-binding [Fusarium albosuccineum]|uniref:NAD(P)-binding n=1 Tax=Fusarium albosuccineum TaxID=1237068 RepID=A0A8H4L591_9HYPO|nr:NAD(P)-binding [Fusarium albosuccineum]
MSVIAVARGTGQLGRSIVETLLANGNYKVIILARKANQVAQEAIEAPVIPLNYANVDDITSALEAHNVHTLISTIVTMNDVEPELNLIKAADKSATTKRFVPSYWATDYPAEFRDTFFVAKNKFQALNALESTSLEYAAFVFGYFLDYFVAPHVKSHLNP